MQIGDPLGQLRPVLALAGSLLIIAGLIDMTGLLAVPGDGIRTAIAGYLLKHV